MTRDEFLCEEVMGWCLHDFSIGSQQETCSKCGKKSNKMTAEDVYLWIASFDDWGKKGRLIANFADLVAEYRGYKEEGK